MFAKRSPSQLRRDELAAALDALESRIEALRAALAEAERDREETAAAAEAARVEEDEGECGRRVVGR